MATQTLLAKYGLRLAAVGSAVSLAIAAPGANGGPSVAGNQDMSSHTAANRTGWYFDQTGGAETMGHIVGGQTGPLFVRSGTDVNVNVTGNVSATKQLVSSVATGTAPLSVASTTIVPNLYVARAALADSSTSIPNLTGPISSVGTVTSITSQTGTGTKFVVDTSPTLITPDIGAATGASLSVSGQLSSTVLTGTAPLVVSSTTVVANLNASLLLGGTWAAPAAIGTTTPAAGTFTSVTANTYTTTVQVLAGTAVTPAITSGAWMTWTVSAASSFAAPSGMLDGETAAVQITQTGGPWTVTFSGITWPAGVAQNLTQASGATDTLYLRKIGGIIYGELVSQSAPFGVNQIVYGDSNGFPTSTLGFAFDGTNIALPAPLTGANGGTGLNTSAASSGQLLIGNGTGFSLATLTAGANVTITNAAGTITIAATGGGGSGTVTSVDVAIAGYTSSGAVTTAGTITMTASTQPANTVYAGPTSGIDATPGFRLLVLADIPATVWTTPGTIGSVTPNTGAFTTLSASGQITSTVITGTAPLSVASTTVVPNLNASLLLGATWAAPAAIGSTTPAAITGTTIVANTSISCTLGLTRSEYHGLSMGRSAATGTDNVFLGQSGARNTTSGSRNIGIGISVLDANTTSSDCVAIGFQALKAVTISGNQNTAVGSSAGQAITTGQTNTAIGYSALKTLTTGSNNTAVGSSALALAATSDANNTAIGAAALGSVAGGSGNTAIGKSAGASVTTGLQNIYIGFGADASAANAQNECVIGSSSAPIRNVYIGQGYAAASNTNALTIQATGGSGTDILGQRLNIAAGRGTGSNQSGALVLQYAPPGTSGTALNTLADGLTLSGLGTVTVNAGDLVLATAGKTISFKAGTNTRAGTATLVGGTVTVSNTTVTVNTIVLLTRKVSAGTPGSFITYTVSAGTSFTITSDSGTDTSTFAYLLIENP